MIYPRLPQLYAELVIDQGDAVHVLDGRPDIHYIYVI